MLAGALAAIGRSRGWPAGEGTQVLLSSERHSALNSPAIVAEVNDRKIEQSRYELAAAALRSDLGRPLNAEERSLVLERLVDEELLVQHAVDSGLAAQDETIRRELVMILLNTLAPSGEAGAGDEGVRALASRSADPGRAVDDGDELDSYIEMLRSGADIRIPSDRAADSDR